MKLLVLALPVFFVYGESAAQNVDKATLKTITAGHHLIAFMPAAVTLNLRSAQKETITPEEVKQTEMKMGFMIQSYFAQSFSEKSDKFNFNILFEDPKETNTALFAHGRGFDTYLSLSTDSLVILSDADVIMTETATVDQTMSSGAATAANIGSILTLGVPLPGNNRVGMILRLADRKSGKVFWQREFPPESFAANSFERCLEKIAKTAAKAFPYRK